MGLPLSRISTADLQREVIARGIAASIGTTTLWRWLSEDAIKPWTHHSWVFPRDPDFWEKAGRILDLYERRWRRKPLSENEFVISADEKPSIQCRRRKYRTTVPAPRRPMRIEHEYFREGAWTYIAAWDVHRAKVFGTCVSKVGIVPFDQFVGTVMARKPYRTAKASVLDHRQCFHSSRTAFAGIMSLKMGWGMFLKNTPLSGVMILKNHKRLHAEPRHLRGKPPPSGIESSI